MPIIQPADGYESNPIVRKAVDVLQEFGGTDLTYSQARRLLPMWQRHADLTRREQQAVLARFARSCRDIEEPGNSGPGW